MTDSSSTQATSKTTILDEAAELTSRDRQDVYGPPSRDFERIAGAWRSLFGWDVTAEQVALAMVIVKVSRLQTTPTHRDSVVDIAGYARCYEMTALDPALDPVTRV